MFRTIISGASVRWLVLGLVAVVAACGPSAGQPSASPGLPSPTATAAPSTTPTQAATLSPEPTSAAVLLTSADLEQTLPAGTYRVGEPFAAPFTITLPSSWMPMALSEGDVEFRKDTGDASPGIVVELVENVFTDPCHGDGPAQPPVLSTVDAVGTAISHMVGFTAGPISDVVIGGYPGKSVVVTNSLDTDTADCVGGPMLPLWTFRGSHGEGAATNGGATEMVWIIDVSGTPVLIDGETFPDTASTAGAEITQIVETIEFDGTVAPAASSPPFDPTPTPPTATIDAAFDIGERSLWLECVGHGSPTFILESGEGLPMWQMTDLRNALGPRGMACTYERANVGRSGEAPTPRTGLEVASDLHALLEAADVPGPYFLIGHSAGGILVQQYAKVFPEDVIGVVAMNPVPPLAASIELAFPHMTPQERADEMAYYDGDNNEALDYKAISEALDAAPAPDIPFELVISTIAQCAHVDDICGRTYAAYEQVMQELADSWPDGNLSQLEAGHELFHDPGEVLALVDAVLERADR